jgi:subtilisin family serine protease
VAGVDAGGFDPTRVTESGKDRGLEMRALHARGITGKGVGIAVIDQPLLVNHVEYADRYGFMKTSGFRR